VTGKSHKAKGRKGIKKDDGRELRWRLIWWWIGWQKEVRTCGM